MNTKESKLEHYFWVIFFSFIGVWLLWTIFTPQKIVEKRAIESEQIAQEKAKLKQLRDLFPLGGKIPFDKLDQVGTPITLPGTDSVYWIAYFPKADLTVWSKKQEDNKIVFRKNGKVPRRGYN